jgi:hypothetical protein
MAKKKIKQSVPPLEKLIHAADATVLGQLVGVLAASGPAVRRQCLEFLQQHVTLTVETKAHTDVETVFSIWDELEPDLADLNEYGGGPDETQDQVTDLLNDLARKLKQCAIPRDARHELLDQVMPYIYSGNSGMDDGLYEIAYAVCQDDEDWRDFAIRLESSGKDYLLNHARGIYRKLGDQDKYLTLRSRRMEYGTDYYDLATFHWEQAEFDKAMAVAREGLQKATGRMDELRAFAAKHDTALKKSSPRSKPNAPGQKPVAARRSIRRQLRQP